MKKNTYDSALLENVATNLFAVLPLIRKHPIHINSLHSQQGIPVSHVQVLNMLDEKEYLSVSEISQRLGITKPNITPLVDKLVLEGYVDRVRDTGDRRVVNVMLLPAGREKLQMVKAYVAQRVNALAESLGEDSLRELNDALDTITRVLAAL